MLQFPIEVFPDIRAVYERLLREITDEQLRPAPATSPPLTLAQIERVICGALEGDARAVLVLAQAEGRLPELQNPERCMVKNGFSLNVGVNWTMPDTPVIWHFQSVGRAQYAAYRQADPPGAASSTRVYLLSSGRLATLQVFDPSEPGPRADVMVYVLNVDDQKQLVAKAHLPGGGIAISPDATGVRLITNRCTKHYELR